LCREQWAHPDDCESWASQAKMGQGQFLQGYPGSFGVDYHVEQPISHGMAVTPDASSLKPYLALKKAEAVRVAAESLAFKQGCAQDRAMWSLSGVTQVHWRKDGPSIWDHVDEEELEEAEAKRSQQRPLNSSDAAGASLLDRRTKFGPRPSELEGTNPLLLTLHGSPQESSRQPRLPAEGSPLPTQLDHFKLHSKGTSVGMQLSPQAGTCRMSKHLPFGHSPHSSRLAQKLMRQLR